MSSKLQDLLKKILPENIKSYLKRIIINIIPCLWNHRNIFHLLQTNRLVRWLTYIITSRQYEIRDLQTIQEEASLNPNRIQFLFKKTSKLHYCPPKYNNFTVGSNVMMEAGDYTNYGLVINNAQIIGCSDLILINDKTALYELKNFNQDGRYAYTDEAICYYEKNRCLLRNHKSNLIINEAVSLAGNYSFNYYHLIFEILTKFKYIQSIDISADIPVVIDQICLDIPQYAELIDILNNPKREIISVKKDVRYKVSRLYYLSKCNLMPPNFTKGSELKNRDTLFDLSSLKFIRDKLLPYKSDNQFPARIFLSRKHASIRRQFNEQEVLEVLKNYDFKEIYPEDYSIADQIQMFKSAEIIAGGSGAAYTNLIYCSQGCKAIIFSYNELPFSGFSTLAEFAGVDLVYITAVNDYTNSLDIHSNFSIDTQKLNYFLSQWMN